MAITVPAAGDEISAATFGAPVANEVNRLSGAVPGVITTGNTLGNSGNFTAGQVMATITIAAVAYRRLIHLGYHALVAYTNGGDLVQKVNGATQAQHRFPTASGSNTINMPLWPIVCPANTAWTYIIEANGTFTTYPDGTFNTIWWIGWGY
jgi:hypothetical protein